MAMGPNFMGRSYRAWLRRDRKSTRLNSSHGYISYAVFCLKKKKTQYTKLARLYRRLLKTLASESIDSDGNNAQRLRMCVALSYLLLGALLSRYSVRDASEA